MAGAYKYRPQYTQNTIGPSPEEKPLMRLTLKRYLVFWYPQYYPGGGWNDFEDSFATLEKARSYVKTGYKKRLGGDFQIIDGESGEDVTVPKVKRIAAALREAQLDEAKRIRDEYLDLGGWE
jgi:hypothetical protein